jgi:hypothetical protein
MSSPPAKPRRKITSDPTTPPLALTPVPPAPPTPVPPALPTVVPPPPVVPQLNAAMLLPNVKQQKVRLSKTAKAAVQMRNNLWPGIDESKLWLRTDLSRKGFTTIPRGMPLFIEMIADASKHVASGKSVPAGKAYLVLWCRVFDEGLVRIDSEAVAAAEAGYSGERNVSTWREHLRVLKELGFIDFKAGPTGPCQYVLLLNPYQAAQRLRVDRKIQELPFTTLLQRMGEFGATDLE